MADPLYRRIANDLERQIESGALASGSRLRAEPEMQEKYRASRNTVRDAVKWLVARGLVETRPGQGTFVVERALPFVTTLSTLPNVGSSEGAVYFMELECTPVVSPTQIAISPADAAVALELGLNEGEEVVSRRQERYVNGTPWSLQTSFYPMSLVEQGAARLMRTADIEEGTVKYLKETLGLTQAGYRDTITVRAPREAEPSFFDIPADGRVAILEAVRTAFDLDGHPMRVTVTLYPADRTRFEINAGKVPERISIAEPAGTDAENAQPTTETAMLPDDDSARN
jgi:GntR family transcriptional regulator